MTSALVGITIVIALVLLVPTHAADAAHERLRTKLGSIHVWRPASYDHATAGIVIYIHGYYTNVDRAWRRHRLPRQFAKSGINALFVACEAPDGPNDDIKWSSLGALLATVAERAELPDGRVIVVAHSGAHRTLSRWFEEDQIDTVVLVDAMYGEIPGLREWLDADDGHRLIDAAAQTRRWSEAIYTEVPGALVFDKFPRKGDLRGARDARIVYVRSQHDHMELVTGGVALPILLRAVDLPIVD